MSETSTNVESSIFSQIRPFLFAGISTMTSTLFVQPTDCLKVRIQIIGEKAGMQGVKPEKNPFRVAKMMWETEGFRAFYRGLDAGLFRQASYGTLRFGIYRYLLETEQTLRLSSGMDADVPLLHKLGLSLTSGFLASIIGSPIDIALVRFQADHTLPVEQRRNYRHVFHAISSIAKREGLPTLWRGFSGFTLRVMAITGAQFTTFEGAKDVIVKMRGIEEADIWARLVAVMFTGVFVVIAGLPFDNVKMKLQKMAHDGEAMPYKGFIDCMVKTVKREGALGPWIGFSSFYVHAAPHTFISLLMMDYLHKYFGDERLK